MKVVFENKFEFTDAQVNIPFMINDTPIGVVYEVTKDTFTVNIFDKYIGLEIMNNNVDAIYLSTKEQISYEEFIKRINKEEVEVNEETLCWLEETLWGYACNHCQTVITKSNLMDLKYCPFCNSKIVGLA